LEQLPLRLPSSSLDETKPWLRSIFSVMLSSKDTAPYFIPGCMLLLLTSGLAHFAMMGWGVPTSGLRRTSG